jgi:hypothetical protein
MRWVAIYFRAVRYEKYRELADRLTMGVAVVDETKVVFMSNLIFPICDSSGRFLTSASKIER